MRRFLRLLALLILLVCCNLTSSTKLRNKKKQKDFCFMLIKNAPISCLCETNVYNVNCWVMKSLTREDPYWNHFTHLHKLRLMQHENGVLSYVPTHILHQMKNLHIFELMYMQIPELAEYTFENLTSLSELRLTHGEIVKLRENAFSNLRNLTILDLGRNKIHEIGRGIFVNLPILRTLYLDHNVITTVRDQAFQNLTSLQKLVLSHNKLINIVRECFQGLGDLQHLDLRNNSLKFIGRYIFADMSQLQVLELDDNHFKTLPSQTFSGLRNLRKLYLSNNQLTRLDSDILVGTPSVHFLDLRYNHLDTMTFDNIKPIVTNLYNSNSSLYLSNNKLTCDCNLAWIFGLRNETRNMNMKILLEKLTCNFDNNNATEKVYVEDLERNLAMEKNVPRQIVQNPEHAGNNSKYSDGGYDDDDDRDVDREDDDHINSELSSPQPIIDGKTICEKKCYIIKRLIDLKTEDLPCPKSTREDLMASEQPSSHHEKAHAGMSGSIWFRSSAQAVRSVLAASLLPLLFVLFT